MQFKRLMIFLLIIFCFNKPLLSQWVQTNGPKGEEWTTAFAVNGKNIYSGTESGIYFSSDNGSNWKEITTNSPIKNVRCLAIQGTNLYAGTFGHGLFRSSDNGVTWIHLENNQMFTYYNCILIDGERIVVSNNNNFSDSGLFISTNSGETWTRVYYQRYSPGDYVTVLCLNGNDFIAGTNLGNVLLSTDKGIEWSIIGKLGGSLISLLAIGNSVYAGTNNNLYYTSDKGDHWNELTAGLEQFNSGYSLVSIGALVFVSCNGTIYSSAINSGHWQKTTGCLSQVSKLVVCEGNLFAGTWGNGIYFSSDLGNNWIEVNSGIINSNVVSLISFGDNLLAKSQGKGFMLSNDGGNSWNPMNLSFTNKRILSFYSNWPNVFAVTDSGGIYLSNDNLKTWKVVNSGMSMPVFIDKFFISGNDLFATTSKGFYYSSNNGTSWNLTNPNILNINCMVKKGDNLFAIIYNDVFISEDNGGNWIKISSNILMSSLVISGNKLFVVTYPDGVLQYDEIENKWIPFNSGLSNQWIASIFTDGTRFFAITENFDLDWCGKTYEVFTSPNNYANWTNITNGMLYKDITSIVNCNNYIYVGTRGNGVWKYPLNEIITYVEKPLADIPEMYLLAQNYPNPFNPVTSIKFSIPQPGHYKMTVYNFIGQEIEVLINNSLSAGVHIINFNAKNLPSGIYFYRLTGKNITKTKKMTLMK